MTDTWINLTNGPPKVADFLSTSGLGPAAVIDKSAGTLYFLGDGNIVTSLSSASNVVAVGLFADIATTTILASANMLFVSRRTAAGAYPMVMKPDPDQTLYTATGDALIAGVTAEGAPQIALAQAAILAILNRVRAKDASNRYWVIDDDAQQVHAGHFGAIMDGSYNEATGAITGTDNAAAIQALIDWRVYLKTGTPSANKDCIIPPGASKVGTLLQLSYGDTFRQVNLTGSGNAFPIGLGGTTLLFSDATRPGVAIQGGRWSRVSKIALLSGGRAWILNNGVSGVADTAKAAGIDDRFMSGWFDPAQPERSPRKRFNPHAGIAVDPFWGAAPAAYTAWAASTAMAVGALKTNGGNLYVADAAGTSAASGGPTGTRDWILDGTVYWHYVGPSTVSSQYPACLPPAFIPLANRITYGKAQLSSESPCSDISITGFACGRSDGCNNNTVQDDFMSLEDVDISYCPVSVSISYTQARNTNMTRVRGSYCHTFATGRMHGGMLGKMSGVWTDVSLLAGCQVALDTRSDQASGGIVFDNFYAEGLQKLATIGTSGITSAGFVFNGGDIGFSHLDTNGKRGVPLSIVGRPGDVNTNSYFLFIGTNIVAFKGALSLDCRTVMNGAGVYSLESVGTISTQALARFINTTAGGYLPPLSGTAWPEQLICYQGANETSFVPSAETTAPRNKRTSRDLPASMHTSSLSPTYGGSTEAIVNPQVAGAFSMNSGGLFNAISTLVGRTLTMTTTFTPSLQAQYQLAVGGVIWLDNGMRFYMAARTGAGPYTFTATLLNGYSYSNAGVIEYEGGAPNLATATGYFLAGGIFTPAYPLFATLTAANANLTNTTKGDATAYGLAATNPVGANDILYADVYTDADTIPQGLLVSSVTTGAYGTEKITLNGNLTASSTRKRLPLWVRGS